MSRAVLLAINAKYVHSSLAVWYLAVGVLRHSRLKHDVKIVETTIHQTDAEIVRQVAEHAPGVVGISSYIWNAGKLPSLLKLLRQSLPDAALVLGGPEASHNAAHWLEQGAGFVLQGEGERSFPALLDALDHPGPDALEAVPGLWRHAGGIPVYNALQAPDCDLPDPYIPEYFDALNGRIAYIETSRGCPFSCAFCLSGGSGARFLPLDTAKNRLHRLSCSGAQTIKLVDRTFNCDPNRAYALFEYVIGLDTDCRFHFEVAADLFDSRMLSLLRTAPPGRIQLEAGLQSFHEPALKATSRRTDLKKAEENILAILSGGNIHVHVDLIAGLPYETLEEFAAGFDRAHAIGAHMLQLGFLKLLHGSVLRKQAEGFGIAYSTEPPYEITGSPWLGAEDFAALKQAENALQNTYNKGRFRSSLRYAASASGLGPFHLYRRLGAAADSHCEELASYATRVYEYLCGLPGVDSGILRDHMVRDWLGSSKGKNMPPFLRSPVGQRRKAAEIAEKLLERRVGRGEAEILASDRPRAVFVDAMDRDPVTGLYKLYFAEIE